MLDPATLTLDAVRERLKIFQDPRFRFDPEPHEYWLGDRLLKSATGVVKEFHEPFNAAEQAPRTAAKTGQTVAEVLADWERAGWVGSRMHEYIEWFYDGLIQNGYYHEDSEVALRSRKFRDLQTKRLTDFVAVGQEIRMFHEASGLSGTLDFLGWHVPTRRLWVLDWKSSKVINTDAVQSRYDRYMYQPFTDVKCNQHNEYSMQICIYRLFLAAVGIPTEGGVIVHIPTGLQPWKLFPAKDYRDRLRFLFDPLPETPQLVLAAA